MPRKAKRRDKPYRPRQVRGNMLIASAVILEPLEKLLFDLKHTHEVETHNDEAVIISADGDVLPAQAYIHVIEDFINHTVGDLLDVAPLTELRQGLAVEDGLTFEVLDRAEKLTRAFKMMLAKMPAEKGQDFLVTTKIKRELAN